MLYRHSIYEEKCEILIINIKIFLIYSYILICIIYKSISILVYTKLFITYTQGKLYAV